MKCICDMPRYQVARTRTFYAYVMAASEEGALAKASELEDTDWEPGDWEPLHDYDVLLEPYD